MATAEQIKSLIRSHFTDDTRFYSAALQVASHEARQGHRALAHDIRDIIDAARKKKGLHVVSFPKNLKGLVLTEDPTTPLSAMATLPAIRERLNRIVHEYRQQNK